MIDRSRRSRPAAAVIVVVTLAMCGAALGALWAWIAPPIHTITALTRSGERVDAFLGTEADNLFVAAAMLIGLLCVLAIVSAVAVWQWQAHRGPVLATALWIGLIAAGASAAGVGAALAHWRYGTPDHQGVALTQENRVHYFTEAPGAFAGHGPLQIAVTLLLPAALAALIYSVLAVAAPRDDLGGWPVDDRLDQRYPASVWASSG
jgi:hypothetical protein